MRLERDRHNWLISNRDATPTDWLSLVRDRYLLRRRNSCSKRRANARRPLLPLSADIPRLACNVGFGSILLKKSKMLPRQNSRKSLSVADSFWGCVLHVAERICSSRRGPPCLTALNASAALKNLVPTAARTSIEPAPLGPFAMSASLIGRLRSSTFRLLPLQCRCRSRARASLRNRHQGPCMGLLLSRSSAVQRMSSFVSFFVRSESPFLRPDPQRARAVARRGLSRLAGAPTFRYASLLRGHTSTASSTTARWGRSG